MLQNNPSLDPVVEILRIAYRRGLAIQREQERKNQAAIDRDISSVENEDPKPEIENQVQIQVGW